jgi:hypothetical protein
MWYLAGIKVGDGLHTLVVSMFMWTALAFVILLLRLYTRAVIVRQLGADDWLMALSMLASIGTVIGGMYGEYCLTPETGALSNRVQRSNMGWDSQSAWQRSRHFST